jgi:anti-sigma factor RsiW
VSVAAARELNCNEIVEMVTDYLDGALDAPTTSALEEHLLACPGCEVYVEQIRQTIAELGRVSSPDLSADTRAALLEAFRTFRRPDR